MAVLIVRKAERKDRTRVMYILSSMVSDEKAGGIWRRGGFERRSF